MSKTLKSCILVLSLCVVATGQASATDYWAKDEETGCAVWSPDPIAEDTKVNWSGGCPLGQAEGTGTLVWIEDDFEIAIYDGGMAGGKLDGQGNLRVRENRDDKFTQARGVFRDGALQGYAEVDGPDGSRYRGGFNDGKYHGDGTLISATGDSYDGEFKDGKPHGLGHYTGMDGEEYQGDYLAGKRHGMGVLILSKEGIYVGEFEDGVPAGSGMYEDKTSGRYHGQFADGKPHGFGTYVAADGTAHQGRFVNGSLEGTALVSKPDENAEVQIWKDGKVEK